MQIGHKVSKSDHNTGSGSHHVEMSHMSIRAADERRARALDGVVKYDATGKGGASAAPTAGTGGGGEPAAVPALALGLLKRWACGKGLHEHDGGAGGGGARVLDPISKSFAMAEVGIVGRALSSSKARGRARSPTTAVGRALSSAVGRALSSPSKTKPKPDESPAPRRASEACVATGGAAPSVAIIGAGGNIGSRLHEVCSLGQPSHSFSLPWSYTPPSPCGTLLSSSMCPPCSPSLM